MTTKRKIWLGVGLLVAILILTNPSLVKFREFIAFEKIEDSGISARTSYFLLFSIFEWKNQSEYNRDDSYTKEKYFGVFNNFYKISEHKIEIRSAADNARIADSFLRAAAKAVATVDSFSLKKDSTAVPAKMEDEQGR